MSIPISLLHASNQLQQQQPQLQQLHQQRQPQPATQFGGQQRIINQHSTQRLPEAMLQVQREYLQSTRGGLGGGGQQQQQRLPPAMQEIQQYLSGGGGGGGNHQLTPVNKPGGSRKTAVRKGVAFDTTPDAFCHSSSTAGRSHVDPTTTIGDLKAQGYTMNATAVAVDSKTWLEYAVKPYSIELSKQCAQPALKIGVVGKVPERHETLRRFLVTSLVDPAEAKFRSAKGFAFSKAIAKIVTDRSMLTITPAVFEIELTVSGAGGPDAGGDQGADPLHPSSSFVEVEFYDITTDDSEWALKKLAQLQVDHTIVVCALGDDRMAPGVSGFFGTGAQSGEFGTGGEEDSEETTEMQSPSSPDNASTDFASAIINGQQLLQQRECISATNTTLLVLPAPGGDNQEEDDDDGHNSRDSETDQQPEVRVIPLPTEFANSNGVGACIYRTYRVNTSAAVQPLADPVLSIITKHQKFENSPAVGATSTPTTSLKAQGIVPSLTELYEPPQRNQSKTRKNQSSSSSSKKSNKSKSSNKTRYPSSGGYRGSGKGNFMGGDGRPPAFGGGGGGWGGAVGPPMVASGAKKDAPLFKVPAARKVLAQNTSAKKPAGGGGFGGAWVSNGFGCGPSWE